MFSLITNFFFAFFIINNNLSYAVNVEEIINDILNFTDYNYNFYVGGGFVINKSKMNK
jgi:hypothetical protein